MAGNLQPIRHSSLTYPNLRDILEGIPASDIQNKTVKSLIENTIHCLDKVNHKVITRILVTRYSDLVLLITNFGGKL